MKNDILSNDITLYISDSIKIVIFKKFMSV
jgi:hypothetical protein